ncbi:precorrin-2 C(20)-methyltransferase [Paracoccus sp. DMF-8]|uniref:precorrin-2 C(20)-methyltransferase n=1 Tax=Paracoccus sp. DMF-8 TaxID=3019445 RepID=UPI0023E3D640|nr:precorrin-2 C(20)-methyltransferase [Paracoccus sp. DMF-8]MDF3607452.1 precorrin-2 C(20)-methyltransferase [Paracoccus sp. DMF-8]
MRPDDKPRGRIICAGLGPGAQDLMSLRTARAIAAARHIAYFRKKGRKGRARATVEGMLPAGVTEHAMEYPVTTELHFGSDGYRQALAAFYDDWAERLTDLTRTDDVVVLCEGDPFFYGSFMHLHLRLQDRAVIEVIPGITGMSGCWTETGRPITWGDDVLTILPGTLPQDELARRLSDADAAVVMKIGRNLPRIRAALETAGRLDDAWLCVEGTMAGQRIAPLAQVDLADCPYFATVILHGNGRRPLAEIE